MDTSLVVRHDVTYLARVPGSAQKAEGISSDRFRNREELDHVHPSLSAFNFGDKGLRLAQSVCELLLDDTGVGGSTSPR
jgi:hypothetical protein